LTLIFLTAVTQKGPVWHLGNTPKTPAKKKEKEREKKQKRWIAADFRVERGGGKGESKKSLGGDFSYLCPFFWRLQVEQNASCENYVGTHVLIELRRCNSIKQQKSHLFWS